MIVAIAVFLAPTLINMEDMYINNVEKRSSDLLRM